MCWRQHHMRSAARDSARPATRYLHRLPCTSACNQATEISQVQVGVCRRSCGGEGWMHGTADTDGVAAATASVGLRLWVAAT